MTSTVLKGLLAAAFSLTLAGCAGMAEMPQMPAMFGMSGEVKLSGGQEVPPVMSAATGTAKITVAEGGAVSGSIMTTGVDATMAHIHMAAAGKNGPVIVQMKKTAEGVWSVVPNATLTAEQLKAYEAGELYVNVHSAANKGGEIRAQLKP
jgi:hypothetical protein